VLTAVALLGTVRTAIEENRPAAESDIQQMVDMAGSGEFDMDEAIKLGERVAERKMTREQAERIVAAQEASEVGRTLAQMTAAERADAFPDYVSELIPNKFPATATTLAAGQRVCGGDLPERRSDYKFIHELGTDVSEVEAGMFAGAAVRLLCPERSVEMLTD
jgi:hypothetical protein